VPITIEGAGRGGGILLNSQGENLSLNYLEIPVSMNSPNKSTYDFGMIIIETNA
jgi:hypothetical protein